MSQRKNVVVSSSYTFKDISFHLTTCHYQKLKPLFELIVSLHYDFSVTSKNNSLLLVYIYIMSFGQHSIWLIQLPS